MATMTATRTQAYRTTCVPESKFEIPSEYVGRQVSQPRYNAETLAAMQEVRDIRAGKIKTKSYTTVAEMNAALDAEEDD